MRGLPATWSVPTIGGIQRTTAILTVACAALLYALASPSMALGCVAGGLLMIGNLYVLAAVGRVILAMAQAGGAARIGVVLAPFKLFLFVAVVYFLITQTRINLFGFMLGVLTQFAGIFIETWRVSALGAGVRPEEQRV